MHHLPIRARGLRTLAGLVAVALAGAACGTTTLSNTGSQQLATDQTLRFPSDSDIGSLDPALIQAETDVELYQNLFDGLLKFDDRLNIVPDLATGMPEISSDQMTYTFHLRPEARFWNGDPVTAQDFIYSFSRAAAEGDRLRHQLRPHHRVRQSEHSFRLAPRPADAERDVGAGRPYPG